MSSPLPSSDLDYIVEALSPFWEQLRDKHIFITGGTGFFGCWLLNSFIWAVEKLGLNAQATVLTRDLSSFKKKAPYLAEHPLLHFHTGDVTNFKFPEKYSYSHIIHAATDPAELNEINLLETIIQGTSHTLNFAKAQAARYLLISSGAVYGKQPTDLSYISEQYAGRPALENPASAYGLGKCIAEHLCHLYKRQHDVESVIARCFAFVGPYLPLNKNFAIGNFLNDAINGRPIMIQGDGTPYRSYLYAADLTTWLWKILLCGQSLRPYNVGSDEPISIAALAELIASRCSSKVAVVIKKTAATHLPERYVPDITRAKTELGLAQKTSLIEAIDATLNWYSSQIQPKKVSHESQ
jgi:dTDP-glucose 4,6-dehydratase